jgi:LuxR family maltose regulon positive regulatory protein
MVLGITVKSLVHTKLNRPRVASQLVDRPRLYALLDAGRTLTIVTAPAGYGKSTLISDWIQRSGLRYAWLSLDAGENDPSVFLSYLLAALATLLPSPVEDFAAGPRLGAAISSAALAHKLADALDKLEESFVLVLDDYHVIGEPAIHLFLSQLLRYPPARLHMVIASRVDPPLPLAAMRAHNELTEIRTRDLRFTNEEAAIYLSQELEQTLDVESLENLVDSTEGWITGLHLASILLRNRDMAQAAALFQGRNRLAIDYLAAEVLADRPPEVRDFLFKTSILQRMCPELCDAILGAPPEGASHSRQLFDQLELEDLFLTSLDDARHWYRYHQLFRQLLLQRMRATISSAEVAGLYAAASRWCSDHGLVGEAITYALDAGDVTQAVVLIEQSRHSVMDQEEWQQLEQWLHLLPRSAIDASPQLLIAEGWLLHKYDALTQVPERLDLAEELLDARELPEAIEGELRGEIEALRSQHYFTTGDQARACQAARRALDRLPATKSSARGVAWLFLAGSLYVSAGRQVALDALAAAFAEDGAQRTAVSGWVLIAKSFIYWMAADLLNLKETAEELFRQARLHNWQESIVWARYFRGNALYELNDLQGAAEDYTEVLNLRHSAPGFAYVNCAFGLASVLQAQGDPQAADAVVQMVREYGRQVGNQSIQYTIAAFQAFQAARQGKLDEAFTWVVGANRAAQSLPIPHFFAPGVAMAAILVRLGTPACLAEADQMLKHLERFLAASHNSRLLIEVLTLKALLRAACQQQADALEALSEAVALAQPGRMVRVFLDADGALDLLLDTLSLTEKEAEFVAKIRRERAHARRAHNQSGAVAPASRHASAPAAVLVQPHHPDLIELLTLRELEVLRLLALRLTNKEIAQALGISVGTVKQHTRSVFSKLHAVNRRDAIVQARNMGFQFDAAYPA